MSTRPTGTSSHQADSPWGFSDREEVIISPGWATPGPVSQQPDHFLDVGKMV